MGTNETDMGYIKDTLTFPMGHATTQGCFVTGKPVLLGGIPGRRAATGRGVTVCVAQAAAHYLGALAGLTAIVQGFGNVGSVAARELVLRGVHVVGISDVRGAVYNPRGLDLDRLQEHAYATGSVRGFSEADTVDPKELLEMPCDLLIPAATANQITAANAPRLRARVIAEGANGPTTPEADAVLADRGIPVIPDILCNAGGVYVSYLEYTQETQQEQMTEEEVCSATDRPDARQVRGGTADGPEAKPLHARRRHDPGRQDRLRGDGRSGTPAVGSRIRLSNPARTGATHYRGKDSPLAVAAFPCGQWNSTGRRTRRGCLVRPCVMSLRSWPINSAISTKDNFGRTRG